MELASRSCHNIVQPVHFMTFTGGNQDLNSELACRDTQPLQNFVNIDYMVQRWKGTQIVTQASSHILQKKSTVRTVKVKVQWKVDDPEMGVYAGPYHFITLSPTACSSGSQSWKSASSSRKTICRIYLRQRRFANSSFKTYVLVSFWYLQIIHEYTPCCASSD